MDENLCHWLCVCMLEIRKDNGEEYTPRSMTQILSGLQRYINSKRQPNNQVKLCDPSSHQFRELHSVLDRLFRELHCKGIGAVRWQSDIITITEELSLWDSGVLGTHSPSALLNNVFFLQWFEFCATRWGRPQATKNIPVVVCR